MFTQLHLRFNKYDFIKNASMYAGSLNWFCPDFISTRKGNLKQCAGSNPTLLIAIDTLTAAIEGCCKVRKLVSECIHRNIFCLCVFTVCSWKMAITLAPKHLAQ